MGERKGKQGRPIAHRESRAKVTVVLLDRHVAYVDRLAVDIRFKHGNAISRGDVLWALVEAAIHSGIDLSEADSAETLATLINEKSPKRRPSR